ncbi:MAG: hypothetical protein PHX80_03730 [Candidatus Nanoarchaeia archaeon]|nr:hypothetical protein [Candidatus Nanoarchaeia archaeon]
MRIRYARKLYISFWNWNPPYGYTESYYDGWNNQLNLGIICINWTTPPLKGDNL